MPSSQTAPDQAQAVPTTLTRSAAERVYGVLELRSRILRNLPRRSRALTKCLRLEKEGMREVVNELYERMDYNELHRMRCDDPYRLQLYLEAVKYVDGYYAEPPNAIRVQLGFPPYPPPPPSDASDISDSTADYDEHETSTRVSQHIGRYTPELFHILIPPLLASFPLLRRPSRLPSSSSSSDAKQYLGHIEVFTVVQVKTGVFPARAAPRVISPSAGYTISTLFDIVMYFTREIPGQFSDTWIDALRRPPYSNGLYKAVDVSTLPVTMNDLQGLAETKFNGGCPHLSEMVRAPEILGWNIHDFHIFQHPSFASLVQLRLIDKGTPVYREGDVHVTFGDLPTVITIVRQSLPNLQGLHFAIRGVETAEIDSWDMLSVDSLERVGSLQELTLLTSQKADPLLNTLRILSGMCSLGAYIRVGPAREEDGVDGEMEALNYLSYLGCQSSIRRNHLAIVDFATLGITALAEVQQIAYHEDGRPMSAGESLAVNLSSYAVKHLATTLDWSPLDKALGNLKSQADSFRAIATGSESEHKLKEGKKVLSAAISARKESEELASQAQNLVRGRKKAEANIRRYLDSLK